MLINVMLIKKTCSKYRKLKKACKISCIFGKTTFPIICSRCSNEDKKIFKKRESIEILKNLVLIIDIEEYKNRYDWKKKNGVRTYVKRSRRKNKLFY